MMLLNDSYCFHIDFVTLLVPIATVGETKSWFPHEVRVIRRRFRGNQS